MMPLSGPEHHREAGDRHGELPLPERLGQVVLADELVAPVVRLAGRAVHRKVLVYGQDVGRRVDHCRTGEDVVARAPLEDVDHALHVLQHVGADVEHHVEILAAENLRELRVIFAVGVQAAHLAGQFCLSLAAVERGDAVPRSAPVRAPGAAR